METSELLAALQEIQRRAERVQNEYDVIQTYVEAPALVNALGAADNGTVSGRRGTGKTHALRYLAERQRTNGDLVMYIDMSSDLGSSEGLYNNPNLSIGERATRLLVDVIGIVHDRLLEDAFDGRGDLSAVEGVLDHFGEILVAENSWRRRRLRRTNRRARERSLLVRLADNRFPRWG